MRVGAHDPRNSANLGVMLDVAHGGHAFVETSAQTFDRYFETDLVPELEAISNRLRGAIDLDGHAFQLMQLAAFAERRESRDADLDSVEPRRTEPGG